MDNSIVKELTQKLSDSHACIAFIFTNDGRTQAFISGHTHDLMATLANEIEKDESVKMIVQGAMNLVQERKFKS